MLYRTALIASALALLFAAGSAAAAPQINQPAPDFEVVDSNGKTHRLSDYSDGVLVLEWTNHDCPFVRKHYNSNNMQTLQQRYAGQGVTWLSVISSAPNTQGHVSPEQANQLTASRSAYPTAVLLDEAGTMGRAYEARVTPHMYVIDRGTLRYMGGIDSIPSASRADIADAEPYAANAIEAVLKGEPVPRAVTRPYGCSIKYGSS